MKPVPGVIVAAFLLCLPSGVFTASFAPVLQEPVAIVCFLAGKAFAKLDGKRTELRLFQRLGPGTVVETDAGFEGRADILYWRSLRIRRKGFCDDRCGHALDSQKGAIQKLAPVPAMIDIAPIARERKTGHTFGCGQDPGRRRGRENRFPTCIPPKVRPTVAQTAVVTFRSCGRVPKIQSRSGRRNREYRVFGGDGFNNGPDFSWRPSARRRVTTGGCEHWTRRNPQCGERRCSRH